MPFRYQRTAELGILFLVLTASSLFADTKEAMRILKTDCLRCHDEEKRKGGLLLTTREGALKGGDTVPAIVPGKPDESFMIELLHAEGDPHMPPKDQLDDATISLLRKWVTEGAEWDAKALAEANIPTGVKVGSLPESYQPINAIETAPNEQRMAVTRGNRIEVFDISGEKATLLRILTGHRDAVQSMAWSPDGKALASGGFQQLLLWDTESWDRIAILDDELNGRVTALAFDPSGDHLVAADSVPAATGKLRIWKSGDWSLAKSIDAHDDSILGLDFSPDGKWLATGSADKLARLWKTGSWDLETTYEAHTGYVLTVEFSPQSDRLATAGDDEAIKVWNLETHKQIHHFTDRIPTLAVNDLIWANDPTAKPAEPKKGEDPPPPPDWIVAATEDGIPRAYTQFVVHDGTQRSGGARSRSWEGLDEAMTALAYLPKKQMVIGGSAKGTLKAWDAKGAVAEFFE